MLPYITVFGKDIPMYGLMMLTGAFLATFLACVRAKKRGLERIDIVLLATFALLFGLLGAKTLFVITDIPNMIEYFKTNEFSLRWIGNRIATAGIVFYGGLIGGMLGPIIYVRMFRLDYWKHADEIVDLSKKQRTIDKVITDCFEQIVYTINQPTGARNFQAVFWNISYYDRYYFESIFGEFRFPDGSRPDWDSLNWLQKRFMVWFNKERTKTILTFPVETMALLSENGDAKDAEYADWTAKMYAEGHSFFTYMSENADSLASCCRLRNEIQDNGFSYTLGAGGVSTGSKSVLTINLNRCVQYAVREGIPYLKYVGEVVELMHKVQTAYNENLKALGSKGMLPLFDSGFINLNRQYLTIGVNGLVEAAEFLGIKINDNPEYVKFVQDILGLIEACNKKFRTKDLMFNCEMIPAENVGVKHAKWDKEDGYVVPRDCYNSYFYVGCEFVIAPRTSLNCCPF